MKLARLVIRRIPVFLMASTLFIVAEQTEAYGPKNEPCTTQGTQIAVGADIASIIKAGVPGDTFLLRRGTHRLNRNLVVPKGAASRPITIKPYNCEDVTLQTNGRNIQPNDYSIIAGLVLTSTGPPRNAILTATESSNDPRTNIIIRNSEFNGGATSSQIRLVGNIQDVIISGNEIQHAKGKRVTLRLLNSGSKKPHNILIDANRFSDCGEDCFQPQGTGTFILSDNDFIGPADENLVDVKSAQTDSYIFNNIFLCDNMRGPCILFHGQSAKGAAMMVEGNLFSNCPIRSNQQVRLSPNTYYVRDNTFDLLDTSCRALVVHRCVDCDISGNTFNNGVLHIGMGGSPSGTIIDDNTFCQSHILDRTGKGYSCRGNAAFDLLDGFKIQCANPVTLQQCNQ